MEILEAAEVYTTDLTENQNKEADQFPHNILAAPRHLLPLTTALSLTSRP